jgi:hypothetical protein
VTENTEVNRLPCAEQQVLANLLDFPGPLLEKCWFSWCEGEDVLSLGLASAIHSLFCLFPY